MSEYPAAAITMESDDDNADMEANEQGLTVNKNSLPLVEMISTYEESAKRCQDI